MNGFSKEWDEVYSKGLQLTAWPWSDVVSLIYRYCSDIVIKKGLVFELGCGSGPNIPFIQSTGMGYYGIEGSKSAVNVVHKRFPELKKKVTVGDFTQEKCFSGIPLVDIVIDRASVTHNDLDDIRKILKSSHKLLKSGGCFIGIDWFSVKHSDFCLGVGGADDNTRTDIERGQFKNVGNVHFSNEKHIRSMFLDFDIISLEEKVINTYEPKDCHQFASWNIVARKR
jgi:SAM-dependent methyltransferase